MNVALFNTEHDGSRPGRHFVDQDGLPFALEVPDATPYPGEGVAISDLFPAVLDFGLSGGASSADFFLTPAASAAYVDLNGQGAAAHASLPSVPADLSCLAAPVPLYSTAK
jgi:hypothetical protein